MATTEITDEAEQDVLIVRYCLEAIPNMEQHIREEQLNVHQIKRDLIAAQTRIRRRKFTPQFAD